MKKNKSTIYERFPSMENRFKQYLPEVKEYMDNIVEFLIESNRIKDVDIVAIDILAESLQTWRLSQKEVSEYGITIINDRKNRQKNPAIDVGKSALRQAVEILQEYGVTALSRLKLEKREKENDGQEESSPLADYLNSIGA